MSEIPSSSRQRLLTTLAHREPDRIPIDFGGSAVTGVHVSSVAALRDYYGLEKRPVKVHEPYQMLGLVEDDLRAAMGLDVTGVFPRKTMFGFPNHQWREWSHNGLDVLVSSGFVVETDLNGDTLIYPEGDRSAPPSGRMPKGGWFFDTIVRQQPFDEDNPSLEDNTEEFSLVSTEDLDHFAREVDAAEASGCGILATFGGTAFGDIALVPAPFMKNPKGIRDVAEWYMATRGRKDFVKAIFARQCEVGIENLKRIHARIGNRVDAVFLCGTDFGTQSSSFCSDATFRDLWLPYYTQVNSWIHSNTTWKCFKHSCGSVERFFNSFIDGGFDIINPVQCSAAGMDPVHLKSTYGDRLTFWGGGVDTQKTLPFGTPHQVREEVLRRCEIFAPGGGFVFDTIHNIQALTPVENIVAMVNAVHEFSGVSH